MKKLENILDKEDYKKIKFQISKTNHLLIKAKVNGIKGNFIIDTGASNSCVGFNEIIFFGLVAVNSKIQASGAGATGMATQIARKNKLQFGSWKVKNIDLVIFDLSHVNAALVSHKAKAVHGIIGADILLQAKAIIDYSNRFIYLK